MYYNTAAVIDADGTYLGKYRKQHIPQVKGFWEKFYFTPGTGGYPVFETAVGKVGVYICYDRHFPEGWRILGLQRRRDRVQPVGHAPRADASTSGGSSSRPPPSRTCTTSARSTGSASSRSATNDFYGQSYFVDPGGQVRRRGRRRLQARADRPRPRPGQDPRGPRPVGVLPGPPARRVRRDRRSLSDDPRGEREGARWTSVWCCRPPRRALA